MGDVADSPPLVIVLAGPNGAGKSTAATRAIPSSMDYVNADEIAKTLASYPSRAADLEAGRLALEEMEQLESRGRRFAIETTLAGRTLAPRIRRLQRGGYVFRLVFVWAPHAEFCIARVASRVRAGGHNIPTETVRRRYQAGLENFSSLYRPIADQWMVLDSTGVTPVLIAEGTMSGEPRVEDADIWSRMKEASGHD